MTERFNEIGRMYETGDHWVIDAVCNGIYAIDEPVAVSSDYPTGYRTHVIVSAGSLPPHSRCIFMGHFPKFPPRVDPEEYSRLRELEEAKELLEQNGFRVEREAEAVA